jgi:hypothetical protein
MKLLRYCTFCEIVFGCKTPDEIKECMSCANVGLCKDRISNYEDSDNVTGGICPTCYFLYKAEKAQKTELQTKT